MNKQEDLIKQQLSSVQFADLSNYDRQNNIYHIPHTNQIKLKINHSYLIKIKESIINNDIHKVNYNEGKVPDIGRYVIDVISILNKIIKVNAVKYDEEKEKETNVWWSGYISLNDIEIIKEC